MKFWVKHIRAIIFGGAIFLALALVVFIWSSEISETVRVSRLAQSSGLIAIDLLYLNLLYSPLLSFWPTMPFKTVYKRAQRSLGLTATGFALLHSYNTFFTMLGGINGLSFLTFGYLSGVLLGIFGLFILIILSLTSTDWAVRNLGIWWKKLHSLVYLAAVLVVVHSLWLGSHISQTSSPLSQIFLLMWIVLILLEALRIDSIIAKKYHTSSRFGVAFTLTTIASIVFLGLLFWPNSSGDSGILPSLHAGHTSIYDTNITQNTQATQVKASSTPSSKMFPTRYTVSLENSSNVRPQTDVTLAFRVFNADTGTQITDFQETYTKLAHLIIVNQNLDTFVHLHPTFEQGLFRVQHQFAAIGKYQLYLNFQPQNEQEQEFAVSLDVGDVTSSVTNSSSTVNTSLVTETTDKPYRLMVLASDQLNADKLSRGQQPITITIEDSTHSGQPVQLESYLGANGHLTMINIDTHEYIHAHPSPNSSSTTSQIQFLPLALYRPISPGFYKLFVEFQVSGVVHTVSFIIKLS